MTLVASEVLGEKNVRLLIRPDENEGSPHHINRSFTKEYDLKKYGISKTNSANYFLSSHASKTPTKKPVKKKNQQYTSIRNSPVVSGLKGGIKIDDTSNSDGGCPDMYKKGTTMSADEPTSQSCPNITLSNILTKDEVNAIKNPKKLHKVLPLRVRCPLCLGDISESSNDKCLTCTCGSCIHRECMKVWKVFGKSCPQCSEYLDTNN